MPIRQYLEDQSVCGFDWTERYPPISAAVAALRTASATIEGTPLNGFSLAESADRWRGKGDGH
jgi:hypothetical protein